MRSPLCASSTLAMLALFAASAVACSDGAGDASASADDGGVDGSTLARSDAATRDATTPPPPPAHPDAATPPHDAAASLASDATADADPDGDAQPDAPVADAAPDDAALDAVAADAAAADAAVDADAAPICPSGTDLCGTTCTDVTTDPNNCGTCGNACPAFGVCAPSASGSACKCPTTKGHTDFCDDVCTDFASDRSNCGACGQVCGPSEVCQGHCVPCAAATPNVCGAQCVSLSNDVSNCGSCGHVCDQSATEQMCISGSCTPRFVQNGLILDRKTGLQWLWPLYATSGSGYAQMTWADAKTACANASIFGTNLGLRLPSLAELQTLIEPGRSPTIDPTAFSGTPASFFWTSTPTWDPNYAMTVNFADGSSPSYYVGAGWFVRCVK